MPGFTGILHVFMLNVILIIAIQTLNRL